MSAEQQQQSKRALFRARCLLEGTCREGQVGSAGRVEGRVENVERLCLWLRRRVIIDGPYDAKLGRRRCE